MSIGLIQHLPGSYRMGGDLGLADEPWLLPISDRAPAAGTSSEPAADTLMRSVQQAARPFRIAANALAAALVLLLTAQFAADWRGAPPASNQVAQALPPTLAADQAAFDGHR